MKRKRTIEEIQRSTLRLQSATIVMLLLAATGQLFIIALRLGWLEVFFR